jgi:hypothetical protein
VAQQNSHIRKYGPLALIDGNCVAYLSCLRDVGNKRPAPTPNRIHRRSEKFDFAEFVAKSGGRSPRTFALVSSGVVQQPSSSAGEVVGVFLSKASGHYFCKPNQGRNGIGAFRLTVGFNGVMMDEEPSTIEAVSERLSSEDYLIQEWMAPFQHPDISRFRDGVINTLRLITFDDETGTRPVAASLRMAISLKSIDSWTQGGVVTAIDLERGVLKPFGIIKKGPEIVESHPGAGIPFRDQPVPHFEEAVTLACRMHAQFDTPRSLGWDIGLLKDGPCFLESNAPWDILMSAQFNPDLVPKILAFNLPRAWETTVRVLLPGNYVERAPTCWGLSRVLGSALVSGRVDHVNRSRIVLTIGGTQRAVQTAVRLFEVKGEDFGVSGVKVAPVHERLAPGFDASAIVADFKPAESVHPA